MKLKIKQLSIFLLILIFLNEITLIMATPYYDTLNTSDTANMATVMGAANRISGNLFLPLMIFVIWMVWVLGSTFIGKSFFRSTLYASFFCSLLSILFVVQSWISPNYMYFLFLLTAVSLIATRLAESLS